MSVLGLCDECGRPSGRGILCLDCIDAQEVE